MFKTQDFEAYVLKILCCYRDLNNLGCLNTAWLIGPLSKIIHLKGYLFICLEDSNVLHLANFSNIFLWGNAIKNMSYCFRKSTAGNPLCFI